MLDAYREHTRERNQLGIPPLPLNAQQMADLVELLKSPHDSLWMQCLVSRCRLTPI